MNSHRFACPGRECHGDKQAAGDRVPAPEWTATRRALLGAAGGTALGLAGCFGNAEVPDPVTLTDRDACDVCGMIITQHPGPSAEVFYRTHEPSGHPNPARFDSTWEAFQYDFRRQDRGWERVAFYVTDYSAVAYRTFTDGGTTVISTHPSAAAFVDARTVTFVVGSRVEGAMGRDLIGFADRADATAFRDEHGGSLATFDDVTRTTIAALAQS